MPLSEWERPAPLTATQRLFLVVALVLSSIAGFQLSVLSADTARFFAWTINPPIGAAFFGAGFIGIAATALLGLWLNDSRQIDPFVPVATIATSAILVASLVHLDRFHFGATDPLPLLAAWVWIVVYVIVPIALAALWWRMRGRLSGWTGLGMISRPGVLPPPPRSLLPVLRAGLAALCVSSAILAAIAFVAPAELRWPYALTPFAARMTGAYLATAAVVSAVILLVDDLRRMRVIPLALVVFAVLALIALVRYPADVSTSGAGIWIYLGILVGSGALGALLLLFANRDPAAVVASPGRAAPV